MHAMNNKISVVINNYNAKRHLAEVLDSVKDFDEIVVCDMERTDHTRDIALARGCRVVTFPKRDYVSAEPARTYAIQQASYHWVLVVDADEVVPSELHDYLYQRIATDDCPQGLYIPRRNRFMNKLKKGTPGDEQLRFFVKEGTVWSPYVHTFPQVKGRVEHIRWQPGLNLVHLAENYVRDVAEKNNRYSDNEVEKRANKHYGVAALLLRPLWHSFRDYVLSGGFRNGVAGLIHSTLIGEYQFLLVAKIIERDLLNKRKEEKESR